MSAGDALRRAPVRNWLLAEAVGGRPYESRRSAGGLLAAPEGFTPEGAEVNEEPPRRAHAVRIALSNGYSWTQQ